MIRLIEKENIEEVEFCSAGLGTAELDTISRTLSDAAVLGNTDHHKVKVDFLTLEGVREVFTTIWATTDKFIMIKGGRYIPINCIIKVAA